MEGVELAGVQQAVEEQMDVDWEEVEELVEEEELVEVEPVELKHVEFSKKI